MWSMTPAPVRNLHILLNSGRVSSFFRRVLDTFKYDRFILNLKLRLMDIKGKHQKTWSRTPAPVRNLHTLLNFSKMSPFFRWILCSFKHKEVLCSNITDFLWNLKHKFMDIKGKHQKRDQGPKSQVRRVLGTFKHDRFFSWYLQTWWFFVKLET